MTGLRLVCSSLRYHWRVQAAVACGVAAATAVLCGALIVGDSMRASLRRLSLDRLGRIEYALVSERFFREALAGELAARADLPRRSAAAVPVILLRSSLEVPQSGGLARAWRVNLVGCDERFWQLGPGGPSRAPQPGQIVLNRPVAEQLGVAEGGHVLVRLPRLGGIPGEMPLGRRGRTVTGEILVLSQIIPAEGLGRFSLHPNQQEPPNAYVPLEWLQERLGQHEKRGPEGDLAEPARVNALLVAGPPGSVEAQLDAAEIQAALRPDLPDYGIRVQKTSRGYLNITSERLILEPAAEEAIRRAIGDRPVQPAFTYLADTIACGKREMPYALIAAVDFTSEPPFGPMRTPEGRPIGQLADDQIVLNAWAAEDLQARPGDTIHVEYFEPESTHGQLRRQGRDFRLAAVVAMAGPAADPDFTPEVPGVTDQQSVANWDLPSVVDTRRVRRKDDQYWQQHRGTPKAFISLAAGRRLWASRFGQTTSLRVPANQGLTPQRLQQRIALEPAAMRLVFQPVRQQGLEASAGTTPFEVLFLLFSSFLLAAAAILVALLFRLGIDRRATEIGILLAIGLRRRQVAGLLLREGLLVAAAGGLLGVIVGIAYAALLLAGLQSWWLAAVNARFLRLELSLKSLAIGFASGVLVALLSIVWSVVQAGGQPPRQLLAGQAAPESTRRRAGQRRLQWAACAGLAAALGLGLWAATLGQEAQAAAFFGAGALVLVAALLGIWTQLAAGSTGPAVGPGGGNLLRLAVRNAARNPMRSTLTIGLVAAAGFVIIAVSAFRIDPSQQKLDRRSGNGGFPLVAESDQPIFHDLNTPQGREALGITPEESQALAGAATIGLRVRPGDDASCLNLYQPRQPRLLGIPGQLIQRGGFAWAAVRPSQGPPEDPGTQTNPWRLLELELGTDPDGVPRVPVVVEKNTAYYSLHLWKGVGETYEIRDDRGRTIRLEIVGLLSGSLFQGDLLISEKAFLRHFPDQSGYRFFLIETSEGQDAAAVGRLLEGALADYGFAVQTTAERLAAFAAVQNTYLSTFQSLGALGLLLGTFGLAAVQMRSVLERRRELALMQATGFGRRKLGWLVTLENAALLGAGLGAGTLAALVAVLPHWLAGGATIPWTSLAATLALVLAVGLLAGLAAVRTLLALPLLACLRSE